MMLSKVVVRRRGEDVYHSCQIAPEGWVCPLCQRCVDCQRSFQTSCPFCGSVVVAIEMPPVPHVSWAEASGNRTGRVYLATPTTTPPGGPHRRLFRLPRDHPGSRRLGEQAGRAGVVRGVL